MTDPLRRLAPVVRVAPAKLNLTLAILGGRPDGYHELHSVMAPLVFGDRLSVAPTTGATDRLHVAGPETVGSGPDNLVLRAVGALRERLGGSVEPPSAGTGGRPFLPALAIRLEKQIPVAAGLGGGSSDAAAATDAALEAWGVDLDAEGRHAVAVALGSDVPFFLAGGLALVTGRGETVKALPPASGPPPGILLVTPAVAVPTAAVYAAFAAGVRPGTGSARLTSAHLASELGSGLTSAALLDRAGILASANDLAPAAAAVAPEIVPCRRALVRVLGRPVGLSGSGPTLWVLYPSPKDAADAAEAVRRAIADGLVPSPGGASPRIVATRLAEPPGPPAESPSESSTEVPSRSMSTAITEEAPQ